MGMQLLVFVLGAFKESRRWFPICTFSLIISLFSQLQLLKVMCDVSKTWIISSRIHKQFSGASSILCRHPPTPFTRSVCIQNKYQDISPAPGSRGSRGRDVASCGLKVTSVG